MDPVDIKLYTSHRSRRLEYIAGIILGDLLGLSYVIITDRRRIGNTPVINYSNEKIEGSFTVVPDGLLFEDFIRKDDPEISFWNDIPVLFPATDQGDLPFDLFSASFWLVSRYEEYRPFMADSHGRYPATESLAYRHGFLDKPVVEVWVKMMSAELIRCYPFLTFRRTVFRPLITLDIDQAWAYRGKGLLRGAAGLMAGMIRGSATERIRTLSGRTADPYDVYDYLDSILAGREEEVIFFLPFGSWSAHDRNSRHGSRMYRDLAAAIAAKYRTGIHFSYRTGRSQELFSKEMDRFEKAAGYRACISRQHYLLMNIPGTCRVLEAQSIDADYSLGYAAAPGFRAGMSQPFRFYDLGRERMAKLILAPFAFMDVTLKDHLAAGRDTALQIISRLAAGVRAVGGSFMSIWHNSSLSEQEGWEGWREVFEYTLQITATDDTIPV